MQFNVHLFTPEGKQFDSKVKRLSLPTEDGIRTLLANHMPIVLPLEIGTLKLINEDERDEYVITDGLCYFNNNEANLFVRTFEHPSEIDVERARRAEARARETLRQNHDDVALLEAEKALQRALVRLQATK